MEATPTQFKLLEQGGVIMKVMITGSSGQLGSDLIRILNSSYRCFPMTRKHLDIRNQHHVNEVVRNIVPDVIIHAAAYTNVDQAESERLEAYETNALGTRNIADAAQQVKAKLIYVSTDYVFDGSKKEPYCESDIPSPRSVYGETKLIGEQFVKRLCDSYFIVRTAWLFGIHGNNFVKKIYKLAHNCNQIYAASDCIGSPTYSLDLATFIAQLMRTTKFGVYHASNQGSCTRYEFARAILESIDLQHVKITPVTSASFNLSAERPLNSALLNQTIHYYRLNSLRPWREALQEYISRDPFFNERGGLFESS